METVLLLPEQTATRAEMRERCLDFAKRMIFNGYKNLTDARRQKLWYDAEWFLTDCFNEGCVGWDDDPVYPCDWFHERFDDKYLPDGERAERKLDRELFWPRYYQRLQAICRSAIDLFDNWAGGVWGWTISDFKRMYDGELPSWFPREGWYHFQDGPSSFAEMTDESQIAI